jgi:hypothetical protein
LDQASILAFVIISWRGAPSSDETSATDLLFPPLANEPLAIFFGHPLFGLAAAGGISAIHCSYSITLP